MKGKRDGSEGCGDREGFAMIGKQSTHGRDGQSLGAAFRKVHAGGTRIPVSTLYGME